MAHGERGVCGGLHHHRIAANQRRHRLPGRNGHREVPGCNQRTDADGAADRSEEHTSELQSHSDLVCRLLLEKKKKLLISDTWVDETGTIVTMAAQNSACSRSVQSAVMPQKILGVLFFTYCCLLVYLRTRQRY